MISSFAQEGATSIVTIHSTDQSTKEYFPSRMPSKNWT